MFTHITTTTARSTRRPRIAGLGLALGLGLSTLAAGSASAEKPETFTESFTFVDVNPCTGDDHEITIDIEGRFIDHGDETGVIAMKRTGTTSDGYVMASGAETLRRNGNGVEFGNLNEMWNAADGSKFQAKGSFRYDYVNGELLADDFVLRCIPG